MSKREIRGGDLFGVILLVCIAVDLVVGLWIESDVFRISFLRANKIALGASIAVGVILLVAGGAMGYASHEAFKRAITASGRIEYVIEQGLFKFVRHPFYLSLILITLSLVPLFDSYLLLAGSIIVTAILVCEAREEERLLVEMFGEEYLGYQRETGMFFPKILGR